MFDRLYKRLDEVDSTRDFTVQDTLEVMSESLEVRLYPDRAWPEYTMHRQLAEICYYKAGLH
jgi:hypothetical protein